MNLIKAFVFVISLLSLYASFLVNESSEIQTLIYNDLNTNQYREESTKRFGNFNMDFPKLSMSAIPIKALAARYYILGERYNEASDLLNESMDYNPYIMWNEATKIDLFNRLEMIDSTLYYAEKAFTALPNNQKHFIELSRAYVITEQKKKIDSSFALVKERALPAIWKYYLASLLTDETNISKYGLDQAKEALIKFADNPELHKDILLSANYVIIGTDDVKKSYELNDLASEEYLKGEYKLAGITYEKAAAFNPLDFSLYENAGVSYFQNKDFNDAVRALLPVVDTLGTLNPKTGKAEFVISQSYANLGEIVKACAYAYISSSYDYRESFKLIGLYCGTGSQQ